MWRRLCKTSMATQISTAQTNTPQMTTSNANTPQIRTANTNPGAVTQ
jgi:hypothetical protein